MNTKILKITTLIAYVIMVVVNYLAISLPLAGKETGVISDSYPNLFAPAGYAFSIWGLIYTLLAAYVVYQFWRKQDVLIVKVNRIFILNALLNAFWIFAWHYNLIWLSLIIMIGLLATLMKVANLLRLSNLSPREKLLMCLPFSVYFGWITVATIANATVFLVYIGWDRFGFSENFWTVLVLLIGALVGSWRLLRDRAVPFGLALVWAYSAILFKHLSADGFAKQYPNIIWTTGLCLGIFVSTMIFIIIKNKK